eukprot:TRINITY_DN1252_c0_g1_i1.p1 TRINITY_DN1252_c0_g1~~TRINITY_DN1252_c0_g1_i1.p1  ORF type:complete len:333 (+),score=112.44 TRINITY_DN1252_c0_g1_i1:104-1000(+)
MNNKKVPFRIDQEDLNKFIRKGGSGSKIGLGLFALGSIAALYSSIYTIPAGHRAVIFHKIWGVLPQTVGEGTHIRLPWFEQVNVYNTRVQPREFNSPTGTKDLQMIVVHLRVLSKPKLELLPTIHRQLGTEYREKILPSLVNEVMKNVVAQFNAPQLLTEREQISQLVKKRLQQRARDFYIDLEDVAITDITFSKEYTNAIEAKQIAQQETERARFVVEKARQDKLQTIIQAEGEAASAKLISEAMQKNPYFIELRRIEAAKHIAHSIASANGKIYLNSDTLMINMLAPLNNKQGNKV